MEKVLNVFVLVTFGLGVALVFIEPIAGVSVFLGNIVLLRLANVKSGPLVRIAYLGLAIAAFSLVLRVVNLIAT